jgi:multimeric flavodoxin WrbA
MKVTAFVGSARKKHTYTAAEQFLKNLQELGGVEYEIVMLSDCDLKICRGCKSCLDHGEELCPLKDDRDLLIKKMADSDGIVLASPNYSFQVSAIMKIFLDRLGFIFHRPRFFGKAFTGIVAQGIYGGEKIVKYLEFVGAGLGFNTVKGCCITTLEPLTEKRRLENDRKIARMSRRFHAQLTKRELPSPSLLFLMVFRMSRTSIRTMLDESWRDYQYFRDRGWFGSDYYYPVRLNPFKKLMGKLFDLIAARMAKSEA